MPIDPTRTASHFINGEYAEGTAGVPIDPGSTNIGACNLAPVGLSFGGAKAPGVGGMV